MRTRNFSIEEEYNRLRAELQRYKRIREKRGCGHSGQFWTSGERGHFACTLCTIQRYKDAMNIAELVLREEKCDCADSHCEHRRKALAAIQAAKGVQSVASRQTGFLCQCKHRSADHENGAGACSMRGFECDCLRFQAAKEGGK